METRARDVLLVGGGVAAARCARALRRAGFAGSVTLVGDEAMPPYNRPPLSKEAVRDEVPPELLLAEPPSWYERRGVELLLGVPAVALDADDRVLELADGRRLRFERCLLATGAEPRRPPVPGGEAALPLRTVADAAAIARLARPGARAAIVGGGFIGVEVAASLAWRGVAVTVVEAADSLWGGALGQHVAAWASAYLESVGVSVRLGAWCTSVEEAGVRLGGELVTADFVVAGIGVRPRTELAGAAGLEVSDGVVVDADGATSAGAVFAAGDVARLRDGVRVEHWHAARESGERAGFAMAGATVPPPRAPWVFSEIGTAKLDVVGVAAGEEQLVAKGVVAWVEDGVARQVAIMDGALPVEEVRALVERGGRVTELGR